MTMLNTREEVADWLDKYGIKNYEISECLVVNAMVMFYCQVSQD